MEHSIWPSPRNVLQQRLTIFGIEYYQMLIATQLLDLLLLFRYSHCTAITDAATEIMGRISTDATVTRCHYEATDSQHARIRQRTVLPSGEVPCIRLLTTISPAHHAGSEQRKRI